MIVVGDENGLIKAVQLGKKTYSTFGQSSRSEGIIGLHRLESNVLISLKLNGIVQLWDTTNIETDGLVEVYSNMDTNISTCAGLRKLPKDNTLLLYSSDGEVELWNVNLSNQCTSTTNTHETDNNNDDINISPSLRFTVKSPISACNVCTDSVAFGGKENDLQLYDYHHGTCVWTAKNVLNDKLNLRVPIWITAIEFMNPLHDSISTGAQILTGTGYKHIRQYDTRTSQRPIHSYDLPTDYRITTLKCTDSGHFLYVGDTAGGVSQWDLRMGKKIGTLKGSNGSIRDIQLYESNASLLSTVSLDRYLNIYDIKTNKLIEKHYLKNRLNCCYILNDNNNSSNGNNRIHKNIKDSDDIDDLLDEYSDEDDDDDDKDDSKGGASSSEENEDDNDDDNDNDNQDDKGDNSDDDNSGSNGENDSDEDIDDDDDEEEEEEDGDDDDQEIQFDAYESDDNDDIDGNDKNNYKNKKNKVNPRYKSNKSHGSSSSKKNLMSKRGDKKQSIQPSKHSNNKRRKY